MNSTWSNDYDTSAVRAAIDEYKDEPSLSEETVTQIADTRSLYYTNQRVSSIRREYLDAMTGNYEDISRRMENIAGALMSAMERRKFDSPDSTNVIKVTIADQEVLISANSCHFFFIYDLFKKDKNFAPLEKIFQSVTSKFGDTIPGTMCKIDKGNTGSHSRGTGMFLIIHEGDRLSFINIRGWQCRPYTCLSSYHLICKSSSDSNTIPYEIELSGETRDTIKFKADHYEIFTFGIKQSVEAPSVAPDTDVSRGAGAGVGAGVGSGADVGSGAGVGSGADYSDSDSDISL